MPAYRISIEWIDHIVTAFGVGRLLAAIDFGQRFDRESIVSAVLGWAAQEGFAQTFSRYGLDQFNSAHAYRNRYLMELTHGIKGMLGI